MPNGFTRYKAHFRCTVIGRRSTIQSTTVHALPLLDLTAFEPVDSTLSLALWSPCGPLLACNHQPVINNYMQRPTCEYQVGLQNAKLHCVLVCQPWRISARKT
eukprot:6195059-Pleurochrysis_carterae.AAC.2